MNQPRIGIAGIGRMGGAAARRLVDQGFSVTLANRTSSRAEGLAAELGCQSASTFRGLAEATDVILVLTSGDGGTSEALFGEHGILAGTSTDSIIVLMSTVDPSLATRTAATGISVVDAPIVGRPLDLMAGKVTILAAGADETLQQVNEALSTLGQVTRLGPLGAGLAMKLAINVVIFSLVTAVSECMAMATSAGVGSETAYEVLTAGTLGSPFLELRRPYFTGTAEQPVQFSISSSQKTLELILQAAAGLGISLPLTSANLQLLSKAADNGWAENDVTSLARFLSLPGSA